MNIGIIGAGNIGAALAGHFQRAGHTVRIANSRGPDTLHDVARSTGAKPVSLSEVAAGAELLVLTIPLKSVPLLPKDVLAKLPATSPIIDTGNYYPLRDGTIPALAEGMVESEWTSRALGRPVIKAFNNIVADSLLHKGAPKGATLRIALAVAGDNSRAKEIVMALIDQIGFAALDAGPLSESWRYQPGTPAYCPDPTMEQLRTLLKRANREKAPISRDKAAKMMAKLPADFPPQDLVRAARLSAGLDILRPRSWMAVLRLGLAVLRG